MKYSIIKSFNEVHLTNNNLILCDIDNTILTNKIIHLKHKTGIKPDINLYIPKYIDKDGFSNLLQRLQMTNSKLYFITSRGKKSIELTTRQFKILNIDINNYPVLFCGETKKSDIVKECININKFENVIFIDDLKYNLYYMKKEFGEKVNCFLFQK